MSQEITLGISAISLLATIAFTIINLYLNQSKQSRAEAIQQENRITRIENVKADSSCLPEIERRLNAIEFAISFKLNPLWAVIEHEIPKLLLKENTFELDNLLKEVQVKSLEYMDMSDMKRLACMLNEEFQIVSKIEEENRQNRAFALIFLKAAVEAKIDERNYRPPLAEESGERNAEQQDP